MSTTKMISEEDHESECLMSYNEGVDDGFWKGLNSQEGYEQRVKEERAVGRKTGYAEGYKQTMEDGYSTTPSKTAQEALGGDLTPSPVPAAVPSSPRSTQELLGAPAFVWSVWDMTVYPSPSLLGLYSSKEKADARKASLLGKPPSFFNHCSILVDQELLDEDWV